MNIPGFVNEKIVYTDINFYNEISGVNIDAVDYDIACVRLDGETNFISIFGLTGYFEGWFSDDEAAVPILAKMKVLIGNITLQLTEWKRTDGLHQNIKNKSRRKIIPLFRILSKN